MLSPKDAIIFTFNKFFYDLLEDIQSTGNDELAKVVKGNYKVKNLQSSKNIELFASSMTDVIQGHVMRALPKELFDLDALQKMIVAKHVPLEKVIDAMGKDNHTTLQCYIYNLTLMKVILDIANNCADQDDTEAMFNQAMLVLKKIQNKDDISSALDDIYDDDIRSLLKLIEATTGETTPQDEGDINDEGMLPQIEGTKIGNMAKEISEELDMSNLKIEKPEDVMKLITGDALGNIIGKVGSKIQEKISSGEVKREDLVSEAFNMMGMLNNPMFKDILKGANMRVDPSKLRSLSTKERLKKKLDEKKKANESSSR